MITLLILMAICLAIVCVLAFVLMPILVIPAFIGFDIVVGIAILKAIFGRKQRNKKEK